MLKYTHDLIERLDICLLYFTVWLTENEQVKNSYYEVYFNQNLEFDLHFCLMLVHVLYLFFHLSYFVQNCMTNKNITRKILQ